MQNTQQLLHNIHDQASRWHSFASQQSLNQTAAEKILAAAKGAIAKRGRFNIVLAGGSTPKSIYELLRSASDVNWGGWYIYHGDERCLPVDHPERNSLMAQQAWLDHVAIPAAQIFNIPAELGPVAAAKQYAALLPQAGEFDMVLLGLGEDGHTASLFPGKVWDDGNDAFAVFDSPKPPSERVTISASRLAKAREVLFLVSGAGKQAAVDDWLAGNGIPANAIKPAAGVDVYSYGVNLS